MKPIIYYYPERLWDMAIIHAQGWGRSYENRTYRTDNGDAPCIDVKDSNGDTLYLLIICDDLYKSADRSQLMTYEERYLIVHENGEAVIMAQNKKEAVKRWIECHDGNRSSMKGIYYMR